MYVDDSEGSPHPAPSPPSPIPADTIPSSPSHLQPVTALSTVSTLALSVACLAISIAELGIQLGLLAISAASSALPLDAMPATASLIVNEHSAGNTGSPSPSEPPSTQLSVNELTAPSSGPPITAGPRIYRPPYITIEQLHNLFPRGDTPNAPWLPAEEIVSEDADLYDEHGDWDHGLDLHNLNQEDLEMDEDEEEEVMRINNPQITASVSETISISPSPTLSPTSVNSPPSYSIVCPTCRRTSLYIDTTNYWTLRDSPTIDNIGWYCSPASSSPKWFKVAVGRRIGVFDNWPEARASISGISGATAYKCTSRVHALSKFHADLAGNLVTFRIVQAGLVPILAADGCGLNV
ncbi:hypothetical protein FIBSPDRAFT_881471 [Athelia psychrophila]|uniref:Ribonuclease H1 N-terminal domain-containing protein n=1 Tax=Athelia psychrophila TaxID=1759441 RepID=A0A166WR00_9AGAM|nr:hypothetical protein FIBSPDRAFT_881471 [Fibularhizoctonia sp. CBS 109695]